MLLEQSPIQNQQTDSDTSYQYVMSGCRALCRPNESSTLTLWWEKEGWCFVISTTDGIDHCGAELQKDPLHAGGLRRPQGPV
jgi:hypothetical protein